MTDEKKFNKVKYKNTFINENYDRVNLTLPKGKKADLQEHAETHGESVNGFINRAIDETIKRDNEKDG